MSSVKPEVWLQCVLLVQINVWITHFQSFQDSTFYFPFPHSADCEMNVYWWVHAWKIFISSGIHLFYTVKLFFYLSFFFNKMGKCRLQILGNDLCVSDKCACKKRTTILLCFSIDAQNSNYEAIISNYTLRLQLNQATGLRQQLQIGLVTVWQVGPTGKGVTLTHNINSIHKWQHEVANQSM